MSYGSVFRKELFVGQVGIVTGGGSGIGRCITHELTSLGAAVMIASRDERKLATVRDELGDSVSTMVCDVRNEGQVRGLIAATLERHGRLDFVVNNAGGQFVAPVDAISQNGWRAVVETNLTGTFLMCREAVTAFMREHGGAIVNIVADMWRGMPGMSHSGAARAGVVNLTQSCAIEWAQYGIRINSVAPGVIKSSGFSNYPESVQAHLQTLPAQIPAKRFGTESEVSAAVAFLLSPAGRYITGTTLRVDGGSSLYGNIFPLADSEPMPEYSGF